MGGSAKSIRESQNLPVRITLPLLTHNGFGKGFPPSPLPPQSKSRKNVSLAADDQIGKFWALTNTVPYGGQSGIFFLFFLSKLH